MGGGHGVEDEVQGVGPALHAFRVSRHDKTENINNPSCSVTVITLNENKIYTVLTGKKHVKL